MKAVKVLLAMVLFFSLVAIISLGIIWYSWQSWAATTILSTIVYGSSAASNYSKKKKQRTNWGYYV